MAAGGYCLEIASERCGPAALRISDGENKRAKAVKFHGRLKVYRVHGYPEKPVVADIATMGFHTAMPPAGSTFYVCTSYALNYTT